MSFLVRLEYATSNNDDIGNIGTTVRAKVKNIAYAKSVTAYNGLGGSDEQFFQMTWLANYGNYDLFGLDLTQTLAGSLAISCMEGGMTDWDENGSASSNYPLYVDGSVVGGNVALNQAVAQQGSAGGVQTSWIKGVILVNNLSYAKNVGIRYTTNNWATWMDTAATYVEPFDSGDDGESWPGNGEQWTFTTPELPYDNSSASFEFAIYYQRLDTGEWFWDNNFSQNYTLSKVAGTTIQ
jgi:hypothetical protein